MDKGVLFIGGTKSGKSALAQKWAELSAHKRIFLATCTSPDEEMKIRIESHKASRKVGWECIEEGINLVSSLSRYQKDNIAKHSCVSSVLLIDCISIWIANLLHHKYEQYVILDMVKELMLFLQSVTSVDNNANLNFAIVTSETGLGIVPETRLGRLYRDLLGEANQIIAANCQSVIFVTCGLPLVLKGTISDNI